MQAKIFLLQFIASNELDDRPLEMKEKNFENSNNDSPSRILTLELMFTSCQQHLTVDLEKLPSSWLWERPSKGYSEGKVDNRNKIGPSYLQSWRDIILKPDVIMNSIQWAHIVSKGTEICFGS